MNSFLHNDHDVLLLVDAHAIIYRAYFALPNLTTSQGKLINAAFGFTRILLTAIRDLEPTHLAVLFDHPKPTFRHKEYKEYKAHREKMPDDLQPQIPLVKQVVDSLNIPRFELEGYEADDLIGTLSRQAAALDTAEEQDQGRKLKTVIVTGDKDLLQLVDSSVHVWLPGRGRRDDREYAREEVEDDLGVYPEQVVDLKALMGDSSDNIPGIRGIGPKTAEKLLNEFGSLEAVYQALEKREEHTDILKGALVKRLENGKENAFLSQKLAQIDQQAPIELNLEQCRVEGYDKQEAVELFQELEFQSLIKELPNDAFETSVQESLF